MQRPDQSPYVRADGQLDTARIRLEHPCRGATCQRCGEGTPCSIRRAADKVRELQARPTARAVNWDRVMGITSLVCALLIVGSWLVNPATLPW